MVTVVLGALLLGEPVTRFVVAGGVLVMGGALRVQSEEEEAGMLPEAPVLSEPREWGPSC